MLEEAVQGSVNGCEAEKAERGKSFWGRLRWALLTEQRSCLRLALDSLAKANHGVFCLNTSEPGAARLEDPLDLWIRASEKNAREVQSILERKLIENG